MTVELSRAKALLKHDIILIGITRKDIRTIVSGVNFIDLLKEKYEEVKLYS